MSDGDLILRGNALEICQEFPDPKGIEKAIAALPAVSAPHPYSLRPDLQKIVDNSKNAPQWDTVRDRMVPVSSPVAELVEALRPFAEVLKGNYSHQSDALPISMGYGKDDLRWVVPLGAFRRAAAALQSGGVEAAEQASQGYGVTP